MKVKAANILLVEDNEDHAELTMRALMEGKIVNEIFHVLDGQEAIDYVYQKGQYADSSRYPIPDLILLDIKLPGIDGLELLQMFKSDPAVSRIPIIMLTTSAKDEEIAKGYRYGANSYIIKPIKLKDFQEKIRELKMYWLITSELPNDAKQ